MYCPNCGAKLDTPNEEICRYCGADLKLPTDASQPQISLEKETKTKNYSKICFITALISFLLALSTTITGLAFILSIRASLYSSFGMISYESTIFPSWGVIGSEERERYLHVIGIGIIILSLAGLLLGSSSLLLRRKAVSYDLNGRLVKIGGIFGILGITISVVGIIFGIILYRSMPFIVAVF